VFLRRLTSTSRICAIVLAFAAIGRAGSQPTKAERPLAGIRLAITVDDIPENGDDLAGVSRVQIVRGVIRALKASAAPGVYGFANAYGLADSPTEIEIYKDWLRAGYALGNHTYDHLNLDQVTAPVFNVNIAELDALLDTLSPVSPLIEHRRVFRYPYLAEGNTLAKRDAVRGYLKANGYRIAEVTTDYNDWAWNDAYLRCSRLHDTKSIHWLEERIVVNAEQAVKADSGLAHKLFGRNIDQIVLTHACALEAVMLRKTLAKLRSDGAILISLDDALRDSAYQINPNITTEGGRTFLEQVAESRHVDTDAFIDNTYSVEKLNAVCSPKNPHLPASGP
jgi:peptidoglycan/xylan/chitin deacetylase (PgdA/CDA1 family)